MFQYNGYWATALFETHLILTVITSAFWEALLGTAHGHPLKKPEGAHYQNQKGGVRMINLSINGKSYSYNGDEDMPLLWFIRENAKLTGTKYGCGIAQCGACTVHLNGEAVRSCVVPMVDVADANVETIENLIKGETLHFVQRAWIEQDVPQCGYCQSGQIMAVVKFLEQFPNPTDKDIDNHHTNICRCGSYIEMRKAIHLAATFQKEGGQ